MPVADEAAAEVAVLGAGDLDPLLVVVSFFEVEEEELLELELSGLEVVELEP